MRFLVVLLAFCCGPALAQGPDAPAPPPAAEEEPAATEDAATEDAATEEAKPTAKERAQAIGGAMSENDYGNVSVELAQPGLGEEKPEEAAPEEATPEEAAPEEAAPEEAAPEEAAPEEAAPEEGEAPEPEKQRARLFSVADLAESLDLYGSFRSHIAVGGGQLEIQNNSSRFGIRAGAAIPGVLTLYARGEWGVRFGASSGLNLDANAGSLGTQGEDSPFFTRLGVIGFDAGKYGELSFGKQWGVYYDVSRMTDRFVVFASAASSTYNAGTDGGLTGTGRASNALAYRLKFFNVRLGGQVQLFSDRPWIVDTWGVSARYEGPFGLRGGVAFNDALLGDTEGEGWIQGIGGEHHAWAFTAALSMSTPSLYAAVLYARTGNHELRLVGPEDDQVAYFYDTDGVEVYFEYLWAGVLGPHVGYQGSIPRDPPDALDDKFAMHRVVYGFRAQFYRFAMVYAEGFFDLGRDVEGDKVSPMLTVGVRVDFSSERALRFALSR